MEELYTKDRVIEENIELGDVCKKEKAQSNEFKLLYTEYAIKEGVSRIREQLNSFYRGTEEVSVMPVMTGAMFFITDLLRQHLKFTAIVQPVVISSFVGNERISIPCIHHAPHFRDIRKNILIVDTIVDSGSSILELKKHLNRNNDKEIKVASLLKRYNTPDNVVDFNAYVLRDNTFVHGYGMDYNQLHREMPVIMGSYV